MSWSDLLRQGTADSTLIFARENCGTGLAHRTQYL